MPGQFNGANLKQGLITAAPMLNAMAAGYSSGRGPYAYMDQGAAMLQEQLKMKRDQEAAAAAAAAFAGLTPGGLGMASKGGYGGTPYKYDSGQPLPKADPGVYGAGKAGIGFAGLPKADTGAMGATGGMGFKSPGEGGVAGAFRAELLAGGLPEHVVDGIMMNAHDESAFNPAAVGDNGAAFGLLQWNGPRKRALESFAASIGGNPADPKVQAQFTIHELKGPERAAFDAVMSTKSAGEAGAAFVNHFERPAEAHRARREAAYLGGSGNVPVTMSAKGESGGGYGTGAVDPMADPYIQQLMQVMAMPGLTPEQQSVVQFQLQSRMEMLKPQTVDMPASFQALDMQARAGGLVPGTPEYQQFMLSGGGGIGESRPAAFEALHMQAIAAGFPEGSEEYKQFMATRGAGLAAESKAIGEARGSAIVGAPAEVQAADETLGFIDEVRNHPGIDWGTGMTSVGNIIPGTPGYNFQNRVNQLLSGGFLTAIDQLRGMGALSNAEGQTATRAISRMDTATSKEEFIAALDDYERVVKAGRDRAASKLPAPADVPTAPPANELGLSEDDLKYLGQP